MQPYNYGKSTGKSCAFSITFSKAHVEALIYAM
jgi:hypothetical protein